MLAAVAIIPAYNESASIANVVHTLVDSGVFTRVVVVNDGSSDDTARVAEAAGAQVITLTPNRGKGGAMLAGIRATTEPVVAFFDADLIGLKQRHAYLVVDPVASGRAVMSVGLRDYGPAYNPLQKAIPFITGERAVLRSVLLTVPEKFWNGWACEVAINEAVRRSGGPVVSTVLPGLSMIAKWNKVGPKKGIEDGVKMIVEVLVAMRNAQNEP